MTSKKRSTIRPAVLAAAVLGAAVLLGCWFLWSRSPPQMGADEEVFQAVDALFTATTARDEKLLGRCEQRLNALKEAGKLPGDASAFLDGVIKRAREGGWQWAAEDLYWFMKGQRREGARGHQPREKDHRRPDSAKH